MQFTKFVDKYPSDENAIELFEGHWCLDVDPQYSDETLDSFISTDARPLEAARFLGFDQRLDGMSVLELGPLEAHHTFVLERLGANVLAIEGNAEAYLKCLIIKEIANLKSRFKLGSFLSLLESNQKKYDMIFASGVLYHMPDPIRLLKLISERTDKAYFWTHYFEDTNNHGRTPEPVSREGVDLTYYRLSNVGRETHEKWMGGIGDSACWMKPDDILTACKTFGFTTVQVVTRTPSSETAPAHFSFFCSR